ncbi:MAG TPA: hypothetical protein VGJ29_14960 [Vicinamibacterales bacterium]
MTLEHLDMAIAFAVVMLVVSILVTIFVQTASAAIGLRGTNLRWGVEQTLRVVYPDLGDHAGHLADLVLRHPNISDSAVTRFAWARELPVIGRWIGRLHYAKAIRVQELIGIMDVLAGGTPAPRDLAAATTDAERMAYIVAATRQTVHVAAVTAAGAMPAGPLAEQIRTVVEPTLGRTDLRAWFDTTMDRVSQRFVTHMRFWTIAFSIVIAFTLHLDSFRVLSQLAANPDARARLDGASTALERLASGTVASPAGNSADTAGGTGANQNASPAPPLLYQDVMRRQLTAQQIDPRSMPGFFADRVTAADWLRATLSGMGKPPGDVEAAVAEYERAVDAGLIANVSARDSDVRRLSDQALTVRGLLNGTGFQLVPDPYHSWDTSPWWPTPVWAGVSFATPRNLIRNVFFVRPANLHFWGILFSAGLLSLGAPFWYNALKTLSALKPTVANKEDQERRA